MHMAPVKHSFNVPSKHWLLARTAAAGQHKAMLTQQEQERLALAKRLRTAIGDHSKKAVAEACGVTEQALTGWLKTGRIHKKHLPTLSRLAGVDLSWLMTGVGIPRPEPPDQSIAEPPPPSYLQAALLEAFEGLTDAQQQQAIRDLQATKRANDELLTGLLARRRTG